MENLKTLENSHTSNFIYAVPIHPPPPSNYFQDDSFVGIQLENPNLVHLNAEKKEIKKTYKPRLKTPQKIIFEDAFEINLEKIEKKKEFELEQIGNDRVKSCEICYEIKEISSFFTISICGHSFCRDCIKNFFQEKINSAQVVKISCPAGCNYDFQEEEIRKIFVNEPKMFEKYLKFKYVTLINLDPHKMWCPGNNCDNILTRNGNEIKIKCDKCGLETCFNCRLAWHEKATCEKAMEKEFKLYKRKFQIKNCPKCKSRIEKNGGCNHMRCSSCNYEFCWLCMRHYKFGHYGLANILGCPGLQFTQINSRKKMILFIVLKILLIFLAIPIAIFVVLPLSIIFGPFILSINFVSESYYSLYDPPITKAGMIFVTIFLGVLGIILTPFLILLVFLPRAVGLLIVSIRG